MSVHIGAQPGDIAERVLLPGDPMRAKWIAETFLKDPVCYTQVRGMLGFTGTWQGGSTGNDLHKSSGEFEPHPPGVFGRFHRALSPLFLL